MSDSLLSKVSLESLARRARDADVDAKQEIIRRAVGEQNEDAWNCFIELHLNLIRRWAGRFLSAYNLRTTTTIIDDISQSAIMSFYERLTDQDHTFILGSVAQTMEYLKATVWSTVTAQRRQRVSLRSMAQLDATEIEALRRIILSPESSGRLVKEQREVLLAELGDNQPPSMEDPTRRLSLRLSAQEALVGVLAAHSAHDNEAALLLRKLTTVRDTTGVEELDDYASPNAKPDEQHFLEESRSRLWNRCLAIIMEGERWLPLQELTPEGLRDVTKDPRLSEMQREELLMLYRHYLDGYGMNEIYERWRIEFNSIRQVYRIKERLLRRLMRHAVQLEEFAGIF
jgi:hypothetical protein